MAGLCCTVIRQFTLITFSNIILCHNIPFVLPVVRDIRARTNDTSRRMNLAVAPVIEAADYELQHALNLIRQGRMFTDNSAALVC